MTGIGGAFDAGMLWIRFVGPTGPEAPFGGIKESGHGSEGGSEAVDAFIVHKYFGIG